MPLLSYLTLAIPFAASPSASILRELFFSSVPIVFPFMSVGPLPAIISTMGHGASFCGIIILPLISPVAVFRVIFSSAACRAAEIINAKSAKMYLLMVRICKKNGTHPVFKRTVLQLFVYQNFPPVLLPNFPPVFAPPALFAANMFSP